MQSNFHQTQTFSVLKQKPMMKSVVVCLIVFIVGCNGLSNKKTDTTMSETGANSAEDLSLVNRKWLQLSNQFEMINVTIS